MLRCEGKNQPASVRIAAKENENKVGKEGEGEEKKKEGERMRVKNKRETKENEGGDGKQTKKGRNKERKRRNGETWGECGETRHTHTLGATKRLAIWVDERHFRICYDLLRSRYTPLTDQTGGNRYSATTDHATHALVIVGMGRDEGEEQRRGGQSSASPLTQAID